MKLGKMLLTLAACSISFSALANVTLNLPNAAQLVLVNGATAKGNGPLNLKNGNNQIAFRYETGYRANDDWHIFNSEVLIVTFAGTNADYTLKLPKIKSEYQADNFNNNPTMTLMNSKGDNVNFKQGVLIKNGFQIDRNFPLEIAKYNLSNAPAALPSAITVSMPVEQPLTTNKDAIMDQVYVSKMLNYWYEKADQTTRENFKAKINQ